MPDLLRCKFFTLLPSTVTDRLVAASMNGAAAALRSFTGMLATWPQMPGVSMFTKFRDVGGGVQWPFNILSERNGEKVFEIFSESVSVNEGLSDDLFTLSTNTKVLPPEK